MDIAQRWNLDDYFYNEVQKTAKHSKNTKELNIFLKFVYWR